MSFEYDLINAMREWDLHINSINLDTGKYHEFRSIGTCKSKCCRYRVFENQLGAHFKCWRRGINRFWFAHSDRLPTMAEKLQMQIERDRIAQDRKEQFERAANKCERFFLRRSDKGARQHPYCLRKQIYPHYAKSARGCLVLPVRDIHYEIQTLQFIKPNGFKQFKAGAASGDGMIWLTEQLPYDYAGVIRLCEGWGTGCTIYSITKSPVICALNAYNMIKVANLLRRHFQHAIVKICADNDQWGKDNVGLECARKASHATAYPLCYPTFDGMDVSGKPTDFNDLLALAGIEKTKRQLILIRR